MAKKKILIVDDEPSITKLLKFALEKTGIYEILCENQGLKALDAIRASRPDLLVLDMNMPDTSGGEIASSLQSDPSLRALPIIFLTGNVSGEEAESGLTISGHPAMAKPINMEKLLQCIEKCLL